MTAENRSNATWEAFAAVNDRRRAIRDFDRTPVSDDDMRAILAAAQLAPSSGNTQPYELHWVKDDATRARVAEACNNQRAARTAGTLVVIVSHHRRVGATADAFNAALQADPALPAKTKAYYDKNMKTLRRAVPFMRLRLLGAMKLVLSTFSTFFELLPIGRTGVSNWLARNSLFAAQNLMLAATARGVDTCPMEGFSAVKVAKALGLPGGSTIPLVIALGHRAGDAVVEPRWRRSFDDVVVVH